MNTLCTSCKGLTEESKQVDLRYCIKSSEAETRKYGVCVEMCVGGAKSRAEMNALFFTAPKRQHLSNACKRNCHTGDTLRCGRGLDVGVST